MKLFSKFFGKRTRTAATPDLSGKHPAARACRLVVENEAVGLHDAGTGETHWVPWNLFQNVQAVIREPFVPDRYAYDIMAEFHRLDIKWDVEGFQGFLDAMRANLDGFDIDGARHAIGMLGREHPRATIYVSPHYPADITTR